MDIQALDRLFSEYIRKRAVYFEGGCEYCRRKTTNYLDLDCSHFHRRGKLSIRFDPDNCSGICRSCHQYLGGNPYMHTEWFKGRLGSERFEALNIRAEIPMKIDKEKVEADLLEKIQLLELA